MKQKDCINCFAPATDPKFFGHCGEECICARGFEPKIYIAGKITGLPWAEVDAAFRETAAFLRSHGYKPLCPVEMFPENEVWDWEEYMLTDLRLIWTHADGLLMLPCWKDSKGARLEHHAAEAKGLPIFYAIDELPRLI